MMKIIISATLLTFVMSCTKDQAPAKIPPARTPTDSLMVYQSENSNGTHGIFSKSFTTGDSILLVANSTMPYVANQRLVYIKAGKTIGYAKLNGVSRFLVDLNAPVNPSLSVDARLISVVDKTIDAYQLLVLDTLGNKTVLYQSTFELRQPEFSMDGAFIYFSHKTAAGNFTIYRISSSGGTASEFITPDITADYTDCAATTDRLYFLQSDKVSGKVSTEICSVNLSGSDFKKHTDFTLNWTQPAFKIENLRKINNSTVIFVSEYGSTNKEIFVAKVDNLSSHSRMTYTNEFESYPCLIPAFVKDF